jgi:uncharacterized membrane protein
MKLQLSRNAWIAIAIVAILVLILLITSPNILQIILAVPVVLFLPGFALTLILFPRNSLSIPEGLVLSIGLSIAFTALSGLLLNLTPWGLQASTLWIALLLCIAVEMAVIFLIRPTGWRRAIVFPRNLNFNPRQWIFMSLATLITLTAIQMARTPAPQANLDGYTIFSAQAGATTNTIRLGVRSEEFQPTKYQIKYQSNISTREGPTLKLSPGETWEQVVPIPVDQLQGQPFTILLYRLDNPTDVYRRVEWWPENH